MKNKFSWFPQSKQDEKRVSEISNHVGEMQSWMQHLEQQVMSVNARLGAVENRMTNSADEIGENNRGLSDSDGRLLALNAESIEHLFSLEKKMDSLSSSVSQLKQTVSSIEDFKNESYNEISSLKQYQKKQPVVMKVGGKEIPLELSGIVGGLICFLVAGLLVVDASEIVLSPWFLSGIGGVFLMSSLIRTHGVVGFVKKIGRVVIPQSGKARVHHSDSTT